MKKNEWTFVASMVEPHYGHAGTVHADLMYISGMETLTDKDKLCLSTRKETLCTQFYIYGCVGLLHPVLMLLKSAITVKKETCQTLYLHMLSLPP